MELITFTSGAGETKNFARAGRYLEIIDAAYAVTIKFTGTNGQQGPSMRDALSGFYSEDEFQGFEVTSATAQVITLMVTDGKGGSRRQPGVVRVIDESTSKTLAGRQGYVYHRRVANAAKFSMAGIITTAPLSIKRLSIFSPTAGLVQIFTGTGAPTDTVSNNPNGLQNKLISSGYLAGTARVTALCAAATPTAGELPGVAYAGALQVPAGVLTSHELTTPILIGAGITFVAVGVAINTEIGIYVDGEEYV